MDLPEVDSSDFPVVAIKRDTLVRRWSESAIDDGKPVIVFHLKGGILNKTDKIIPETKVTGKIRLVFPETPIVEKEIYVNSGFESAVSKNNPWRPNEVREFNIQTIDIPIIYRNYSPSDAMFALNLKAKDPLGYEFDDAIREQDLITQWNTLPLEK